MIEFFFDCSSPWTYLAFHNIQPLVKEFGVEISWRPILVGGIFNTVNPSVYAQRETPVPLKARYMKKDLADWARSAGLAIKMPPTVFPVNSVKAMRGCIWLGNKEMVPFARAVFHEGPAQPLLTDLDYRKKILWLWWLRHSPPSLRGAKRRSNPSIRYAALWIASLRSQ